MKIEMRERGVRQMERGGGERDSGRVRELFYTSCFCLVCTLSSVGV